MIYGKAEVDVELVNIDVLEVLVVADEDVLLNELVLLPAVDEEETDEVDETVELDVTAMLDELELDWEDVLLLELDTDTGLTLLYIDNRFAPPHYKGH